jgi:hypothetical protein
MSFSTGGVVGCGLLGPPIDARPLFTPGHTELIATLRALEPADWEREAVAGWTPSAMSRPMCWATATGAWRATATATAAARHRPPANRWRASSTA